MSIRASQDASFAGLVERWFVGALRHLWSQCPGDPPAGWAELPLGGDLTALFPGEQSTTVELTVGRHEDYGARTKRFTWSPAQLRTFLDRAAEPGMDATVRLNQAGADPFPALVDVELVRPDDVPDWAYLRASFDGIALRRAEFANRAVGFLRGFAEVGDPSFGHIAPRFDNNRTALEMLLGLIPDWDIDRSREVLRGYSWVTICAQELGDRLGGAPALEATGAFAEIAELAAGGYWLQATPTFEGFDADAAERVFRVVAPVLPAGQPNDPSSWSDRDRYLVVIEDASAFRTG